MRWWLLLGLEGIAVIILSLLLWCFIERKIRVGRVWLTERCRVASGLLTKDRCEISYVYIDLHIIT